MKRFIFNIIGLLMGVSVALAQGNVDKIYYQFTPEGAIVYRCDPNYQGAVIIPEEITYEGRTYPVVAIGDVAFNCCVGLTWVEFPNTITHIGNYAFRECENLKALNLPHSLKTIGLAAFSQCNTITSVSIPKSVTEIGPRAFNSCRELRFVSLPESSLEIESEAFFNCPIYRVEIANPDPNSIIIKENSFRGIKKATLLVPKGSKKAYKKVKPWNGFNIKEVEE